MRRREFLKSSFSSLAYFSTLATTPTWIAQTAKALSLQCLPPDRILVIVQQSGGNDGLNTVIPRTDPLYYDANVRPTLAVPFGSEINLDGLNGFHPRLWRLANWYHYGNMAIVNNVGYVNPNLSHFVATDYYDYGFSPGITPPVAGWVSRFVDNNCPGADPAALALLGSGLSVVPGAFLGMANYTPPAVADPDSFDFQFNSDADLRRAAINAFNAAPPDLTAIDFLQRSENTAQASISQIAQAVATGTLVGGAYPDGSLGEGLKLVSQVIRSGFGTRIFYVSQGGYDTHANQVDSGNPLFAGDHPVLLDAFDRALDAFMTEMVFSGNLERVLLMTFSEFGRRVAENGSRGSDHGAANNLLVLGGQVRGGVYGGQPDLVNLIKGNLNHRIDFRSVYSRVIETWLGGDARPVFGDALYAGTIAPQLPAINFLNIRNAVPAARWNNYH